MEIIVFKSYELLNNTGRENLEVTNTKLLPMVVVSDCSHYQPIVNNFSFRPILNDESAVERLELSVNNCCIVNPVFSSVLHGK